MDPAGYTNGYATDSSGTSGTKQWHASVAAEGYVYIIGGCGSLSQGNTSCPSPLTTVEAAQINADGSLGNWSTRSTLPEGRWAGSAAYYNGYIYMTGGCASSLGTCVHRGTSYYAQITDTSGTLGAWQTESDAFTARREHATVITDGYVYIIGGFTSASTPSVEKAPITDPGFGTFGGVANLPAGRTRLAAVAQGGFIYVSGGFATTTVLRGQIGAGGSISAWTDSGTISSGGGDNAMAVYNGYLYVINSGTSVDYAPINSDGSLGTFVSNQARSGSRLLMGATVSSNGYLILWGGCTGISSTQCTGAATNNEAALIQNGGPGTVSGWTQDTGGDAGARMKHGLVAYNGYIYVLAGCTTLPCTSTGQQTPGAQYAPINDDGSIGTWSNLPNMPNTVGSGRMSFGAVALNGYLYYFGGEVRTGITNTTNVLSDVWYGPLDSGTGGVSGWTQTSANLGAGYTNISVLTFKDKIYFDSGSTIKFATPNPTTGDITSWTSLNNAPSAGRNSAGMFLHNGYIYLMGGCGPACNQTDGINTYEYAPIDNSGNTTGAWVTSTSLLPVKRITSQDIYVYNGFVYILPDAPLETGKSGLEAYFAAIVGPGKFGQWYSSAAMSGDRKTGARTMYNGRFYMHGGQDNSSVYSSMYYGALQSIPRVGSYTRLFDFGAGVRPAKLITRGTKATSTNLQANYTSSNNTAISLDSQSLNSYLDLNGANALSISLGATRTLSRYFKLQYILDDTRSAVFPDAGYETSISNCDLYFTSGGTNRLKGGRMFTGGKDRGLGVSP
jgi:hypothetical protein